MDEADKSSTSRRSILKGAMALPVLTVPFSFNSSEASEPPQIKDLLHLAIPDDHAKPYANAGDFVLYNPAEREPVHGGVFVMLCASGRHFVVRCWSAGKKGKLWYSAAPNQPEIRTKIVGPHTTEFLRGFMLGRVVLSVNRVS